MVAERNSGKNNRRFSAAGNGKRRKNPYGEIESALERDDAIKIFGAEHVRREKKRIKQLKRRIKAIVPSESWFRENWYRGEPFPPGGDESLMVPCKSEVCNGKLFPPQYVSSRGYCQDCVYCSMSKLQLSQIPSSASTINIAKVKCAIKRGKQAVGGV